MSDEEYVQPAINVGFTKPMELAHEPEREEPTPFESNDAGLREAANELIESPAEPVPVTFTDARTGKPTDPNETLSAEAASRELARYRNSIADAKEAQSDAVTAEIIDHIQGNAQNPAFQSQQPQQEAQQEPAPQPEAQPAYEVPNGIDPDVARVLAENPKALHAEVQQVHTAPQSLVDATRANAQMAAASLFAAFPEIANVPADQIRGAIQVISQQDPAKAAAIVNHIKTVEAQVGAWQQLQASQQADAQRQYRQQFNEFAKAEDAKAEKLLPGVSDKKLADQAVTTLKNLGFSESDLARAWTGEATISLRDHRSQVLLAKAAMWDQAQAGLQKATRAPHPPVMRPGVSGARADEFDQSQLSDLNRRLLKTGSVKDAARLILARRQNRG